MNVERLSRLVIASLVLCFLQANSAVSASDLYLPKMPETYARDKASPEYKAFNKGWLKLYNQEADGARELFKSAARDFPNSERIAFGQSLVEYYLGEPTVAMPMVEKALSKHPASKELKMLKAMILCNDEHPELAAKLYDQLLSQDKNNPELLRLRCAALIGQFKLAQAKSDIERCLKLAPQWKNPLHLKGQIAFYEGQIKAAIDNYSKAIVDKNDPNLAEILESRAEAYTRLYEFAKARADISAADDKTYFGLDSYNENIANAEYEYIHRESNIARRFLIAVGFPLAFQNDLGLLTVAGKAPQDKDKKDALEKLKDVWGFTDRKQTLEMIWYLTSGAGNDEWMELWKEKRTLVGTLEQKRRQLLSKHHHTSYGKIDLVMKYGDEFGERGVTGYDLGRSTNLCRDAVRAGILTEKEGLMIMLHNASALQSTYKSWEQYHREYLVGRSFWNPDIQAQDQAGMQLAANSYLKDPQSPICQIPWNTPISYETVFPGEKSSAQKAQTPNSKNSTEAKTSPECHCSD
ncbi:MAG: DUF1266 domain-containing protein [Candidatus Obscuribacter sp.]|nr:DUF1266 domain-containing protein [Candidatus Obscuribacter sp.]MBP6350822.1 DUF1266 domain-containing protein [Candidatus Obscuribacter sp.]MBP6593938.1 DUF1266 domain-containing protein [Candidatus Obscuribacter sp.]MBP7577222.1 DUF1266 domain-containing protein [Candidatus Obscuribacter sp.]